MLKMILYHDSLTARDANNTIPNNGSGLILMHRPEPIQSLLAVPHFLLTLIAQLNKELDENKTGPETFLLKTAITEAEEALAQHRLLLNALSGLQHK